MNKYNDSDTILAIINNSLDNVQFGIAKRLRSRRLEKGWSQVELAKRSGVTLASLRRFEKTSEISLKSLLVLAKTLHLIDDFNAIFATPLFQNIDEVIHFSNHKNKKKGKTS